MKLKERCKTSNQMLKNKHGFLSHYAIEAMKSFEKYQILRFKYDTFSMGADKNQYFVKKVHIKS
jgi:hypothetical protein